MTETEIEQYFTGVATRAKYLQHTSDSPAFFRVKSKNDPDEFDNAVKNVSKKTVLLLEIGSGTIDGDDTPRDQMRIGLHVLIKTDEKFENIKTAKDTAKAILIKLLACMARDCKAQYDYADDTAGPLRQLKIIADKKVKYDDMDGIDENWYGKCFYFDLRGDIAMVYDPNDYN